MNGELDLQFCQRAPTNAAKCGQIGWFEGGVVVARVYDDAGRKKRRDVI